MWEAFNNREVAAAIWLLVITPFILRSKDVREVLSQLLKAVFVKQVLVPVLLMATYVTLIVFGLLRLDLWDSSLLKDTILWFCFVAMVTMVRFVAAKGGNLPIRALVLDNLKIVIVLEFLVNAYTFPLGYELVIVPAVTAVAMLQVYAELQKEHRSVYILTGGVLAIIGILTVVYALVHVISDYQTLGTLTTLKSFILPLLLSITLMPAVYLLALYTSYESLFIGFKFGEEKNAELVKYAKWSIFRHCFLSVKKVSRLKPYDLMRLQSREDVDRLLCELDDRVN